MSQQINLYRDPRQQPRQPVDSFHIALAGGATLLLLLALTAWSWQQATTLEREAESLAAQRDAVAARLASLTREVNQAWADQPDASELERLEAEIEAKEGLVDYLQEGPLADRTGFVAHLEGLARRVVDDLWLVRIVLSDGGHGLRLRGHALDPERVPEFIAALGREPVYAGHTFRRFAIQRPEDNAGRIDFDIASEPGNDAGDTRRRRR